MVVTASAAAKTVASPAAWTHLMTSLQDIFKINENQPLDSLLSSTDTDKNKELQALLEKIRSNELDSINTEQLKVQLSIIQDHLQNVKRSKELLGSLHTNLSKIIDTMPESYEGTYNITDSDSTITEEVPPGGKQYWTSAFNPTGSIPLHSEVAYKPKKNNLEEEWFQCIVLKVSNDGIKYEVQDPEPDELGNAGKIFKCTWKEIIPIPPVKAKATLKPYPMGTKVLARYPETTTFYPAVVSRDHKKDNKICKLRFDGEEEVNKETEVDRRLVLPFPTISALPVNNARRS